MSGWSDDNEEDTRYFQKVEDQLLDLWQAASPVKPVTAQVEDQTAAAHPLPKTSDNVRRGEQRRPRRPRGTREQKEQPDTYSVFVGNVPLNTFEISLVEHFEPYGRIVDCFIQHQVLPNSKNTYGFVRFEREHEAQTALRALNKTLFNGSYLRVEPCNTKPKEHTDTDLRKKTYRQQRVQAMVPDDEEKLCHLIESYTYLLGQSVHNDATLMDLGEFLNCVNTQKNTLVDVHKVYEHEITVDLCELQETFIQSFDIEESANVDVHHKKKSRISKIQQK